MAGWDMFFFFFGTKTLRNALPYNAAEKVKIRVLGSRFQVPFTRAALLSTKNQPRHVYPRRFSQLAENSSREGQSEPREFASVSHR
jgi:hypothetical protein